MTLPITLGVGCALAAVGVFAGWRGARPPNPLKGPRLIPWRAIMMLCAAGALAAMGFAARMAGIHPPGR